MHRRTPILLALVLLASPILAGGADAYVPAALQRDCGELGDAGDTRATARPLPPNESCSGRLGPDDAADWVRFDVVATQRLDLVISLGALSAITWCLHDPDGVVRIGCDTLTGGRVYPTFFFDKSGTWHISVVGASDPPRASYLLSVNLGATPVYDDCGTLRDAGNDRDHALALPHVGACTGNLNRDSHDRDDWFGFETTGPARIVLQTGRGDGRWHPSTCLGPADAAVRCAGSYEGTYVADEVVGYATGAGAWHVGISLPINVEYSFALAMQPIPPPDDCGSGQDAGGDAAGAVTLALPVQCEGIFPGNDPADWYAFDAVAGQVFELVRSTDAPMEVCLLRPDGSEHACIGESGDAMRVILDLTGRYHLRLDLHAAYGEYALDALLRFPDTSGQDDCGAGGDAGDLRSGAVLLSTPVACSGATDEHAFDLADWYALDVPAAGTPISLTLDPVGEADNDLCLYAPGADEPTECRATPGAFRERIELMAPDEGRWLLRVSTGTLSGGYLLDARLESTQDDCGSGWDAGDAPADALRLAPPVVRCEATFPALLGDVEDWYVVSLEEGSHVAIATDQNSILRPARVCIYDPDEPSSPVACPPGSGRDVQPAWRAPHAGDWLLRVTGQALEYRLTVATVEPVT